MRDYKKEYREYHARPEQKKNRAARNLWNRRLKGRVPAGKEIDHRRPLAAGGGNTQNNIRFRSVSANRGDKSHMKTAQKTPARTDSRPSKAEQFELTTRQALYGLASSALAGGGTYMLARKANNRSIQHALQDGRVAKSPLGMAMQEAAQAVKERGDAMSLDNIMQEAAARYPSQLSAALDKQASLLGAGAMIGGMFLPVMKTNLIGENLAKIKGMRVLKGNLLGNKVRNKFLRLQEGKGAGRNYTTERFENLAYGPAMIPIESGLTGLTTAIHHARVRKAGGALPADMSLNFDEDVKSTKRMYDGLKEQARSGISVDADSWAEAVLKNRSKTRKLKRDERLLGRNLTIAELSDALSEEPVREALSGLGVNLKNPQVAVRELLTRFAPPDALGEGIRPDTTLGQIRSRLIEQGNAARAARVGEADPNAGFGTKLRQLARDFIFDPNMSAAEQKGVLLQHIPLDASENLYDSPLRNAASRGFGAFTRATGSDKVDEYARRAGRGLLNLANKGADAAEDYGNRGGRKAGDVAQRLKRRARTPNPV